jgi:hypothetical protein
MIKNTNNIIIVADTAAIILQSVGTWDLKYYKKKINEN